MALVHWLVSVLFPIRWSDRVLPGWLRWPAHGALVVAAGWGLFQVQQRLHLSRSLHVPWPQWQNWWLTALGLLMYVAAWTLYGACRRGATVPGDSGDVDQAWHKALTALEKAGLDITAVPLFLVLGRPLGGLPALFQASRVSFPVIGDNAEPVQVFAGPDGIFVCCAGSSVLGALAERLHKTARANAAGPMTMGNRLSDMQSILARARQEGRGPDQLHADERALIGQLVSVEQQGASTAVSGPAALAADAVVQAKARFASLCRLVAAARAPVCPVNGVLILLPLAGTGSEEVALQTANAVQADVRTARAMLGLDCPLYPLLVDVETAPGFGEFLRQLPDSHRVALLGRRFPLAPDLEPSEVPAMLDSGVDWLCGTLLPWYAYSLLHFDADPQAGLERNGRLVQLVEFFHERRERLSRLFIRGLLIDRGPGPLLAGCFLAATGADAVGEQAFVAELFRDLLHSQNFVSWTEQAKSADLWRRRAAGLGYATLGVATLAGIAVSAVGWPW